MSPSVAAPGGPVTAFDDQVRDAPALEALARLYGADLERFGVSSFALGHLFGLNRPSIMYLTTWARTWMEHYAVNGFITDDPIVAEAVRTPEPFTWAELGTRSAIAANRVLVAARTYGFHEGFVVPVHGPGEARGLIAMAAPRLRLPEADRPGVVARARLVYEAARRLHDRAQGTKPSLPPREREALALVAAGLEDAAIGAALGITKTSAHVYVERAKRRLGATTRAQAVATAMREGAL